MKVTERFTQLCLEWEEKSNKLEESTDREDINLEDGRQGK